LPQLYPPEKLHKYPHLMVSDIRIWEQYLETVEYEFKSFEYDVHVGTGIEVNPEWEPAIKLMALSLSEKRIDVVGWVGNVPTIIEVKPSASLAAIGQVLAYRALYVQRFPDRVTPLLMIVTDMESPDMRFLCREFGIKLVVVG
jgi:hypothetical protein